MIAKCIQKIKRNNKIVGYKLQDLSGNTIELRTEELKEAIKKNNIAVVNLKLTSNNRIISTEKIGKSKEIQFNDSWITELNSRKAIYFKSNVNIDTMKQKALMIGAKLEQLDNNVYILENENSIGIISDKQLKLNQNISGLFSYAMFNSIDLRDLDSSEVTNMSDMFYACEATKINLSNFNTSKVKNMSYMFALCEMQELDLSSFNTSNVENMSCMFKLARINELDLSSFVTDSIDTNLYPAGGFADMFLNSKITIKVNDKRIKEEYANSLNKRHSEVCDVNTMKFNART